METIKGITLEPIKFEKGDSIHAFYEYGLYLYSFESVEKFKEFVRINKWWYEHMRPEWKQKFLELAKKEEMKNEHAI